MIDCCGFTTRDICLPEPEERYTEAEPSYQAPYREPVVMPETDRSRAWKFRLTNARKKEVKL
jgi:hypothetical protein